MDALEIITGRVSPAQLVEPGPSAAQLEAMLAAAGSAPDHGRLTPWRFVVIEGDARRAFGDLLAQSLARREPAAPAAKLDAERRKALRAPVIVVVAAAVQDDAKVPGIEQIVAAGAAAQNLLLAAHAQGLGGFWRTGAPAYDPAIKEALGLDPAATIVGFLYLGSIGMPGRPRQLDLAPVVRRWAP